MCLDILFIGHSFRYVYLRAFDFACQVLRHDYLVIHFYGLYGGVIGQGFIMLRMNKGIGRWNTRGRECLQSKGWLLFQAAYCVIILFKGQFSKHVRWIACCMR